MTCFHISDALLMTQFLMALWKNKTLRRLKMLGGIYFTECGLPLNKPSNLPGKMNLKHSFGSFK